MKVIQKQHPAGGRVVALGMFDGVHLGHRALLNTAKQYSREHGIPLRVCTFSRHPLEVIRPECTPDQLSTIPEKAVQMYGLGVDEMELMPFDRRTADMEPEAFLEQLRSSMKLCAVVAGWNYTFGKHGKGNASMLLEDGRKHGYDVLIEPPARMDDGTVISSTFVRQKLKDGDIEDVSELLGYDYMLSGTVSHGKHRGQGLGFPTANIEPWRKKALPKYGVYTCLLETDTETLPAVVNIGVQPTMPSGRVTVEAHVLEESPELYGQKVRISLMKMLREEKRFGSPDELREQITRDREEALRLFDMA